MITFSNLGNMGRIGNQIFQLSSSIATALRHNDLYIFPPWKEENHFNLHNCFSNNIKVNKVYQEPFFHYKEIPYNINKNEVLDLKGYFQSYLYFDDFKEQILNLLTPNYNVEREPELCAVHVRRSDYIKYQNFHPLMTMDYYHKAMELSGCKKFLIFSDDIAYCKQNFIGNQFEFSENYEAYIDLALMIKKCEHLIIANSSFSWCGAYFNRNANKKIIAPKNWFGPGLSHSVADLIPKDWIVI